MLQQRSLKLKHVFLLYKQLLAHVLTLQLLPAVFDFCN